MIIASRPADLFPPSGFWYKMANADLFDLRIYDPLRPRSAQTRVMMRGQWASIPIVSGASGTLISQARILPVETPRALAELVTERYTGSRHWGRLGGRVVDLINEVHTDHLWQLNLHLILGIRELLGITTPVAIGRAQERPGGGDGLASVMAEYGASVFLSEPAGRPYVGGDESYQRDGLNIAWSAHRPATGDSILSVLMDHDDPMSVVLAEERRPWDRRRAEDVSA